MYRLHRVALLARRPADLAVSYQAVGVEALAGQHL